MMASADASSPLQARRWNSRYAGWQISCAKPAPHAIAEIPCHAGFDDGLGEGTPYPPARPDSHAWKIRPEYYRSARRRWSPRKASAARPAARA